MGRNHQGHGTKIKHQTANRPAPTATVVLD